MTSRKGEGMGITELLQAVIVSFGFVGWGLLGNYSQAGSGWSSLMVNAYVSVSILLFFRKDFLTGFPNSKAMFILFIAGLLNGTAVCLYSNRVANPASANPSRFMVTVFVLMAVVTPLLEWTLKGTLPTGKQSVGFCLAALSIYFLSK